MNTPAPAPALRPKHWLLAKSRQWHAWGGLFAALFLLVAGSTGIVLNYKGPIFRALGLEPATPPGKGPKPAGKPAPAFTTASGLAAAAVNADQALALAREQLGDVPLDRIELKAEHGELTWKVKARGGSELQVNAQTGTHFVKGEYERLGKPGSDGVPVKSFDWGKLALKLHTGDIGGAWGKALMTFAAVLLLLLSVSGLYLYAKPVLIRRANVRARQAVPVPALAKPASDLPAKPAVS